MKKSELPKKCLVRGKKQTIYYRPCETQKICTGLLLEDAEYKDVINWISEFHRKPTRKKRSKYENWTAARLYPVFVEQRKKSKKPRPPAANTLVNWETAKKHLKGTPIWIGMPLKSVEYDDCQDFCDENQGKGWDPLRSITLVKTMHNWFRKRRVFDAYQLEYCTDTAKPEDERVGRALEDWEVTVLFREVEHSKSPVAKPKFHLALKYGMRKSEINKLKRGWIIDEDRVIRLPSAYVKNRRSREIPLSDEMYEMLLPLMEGKEADDCIFTDMKGVTPETRVHDGSWWYNLRKRAKVKCRYHDMRITCATRMAQAGIDQYEATKILGHDKEINDIYTKFFNRKRQRELLRRVDWENTWQELMEKPSHLKVVKS